tara:strand:- start:1305 stop:1724 length:420 start_codon:yes stop_codon:yes gene_type:complete
MWCDEIIRLFNNTYNLNLSIQRSEFFYELFSSTFRFEINHEDIEDIDDEDCSITITKLENNTETEYEIDRFIFWFHTIFYRELVNELELLNNGNNEYDDIVYRVESLERVIDSFKYVQKIDDFEDFFESLRIYIENMNY